MKRGRPEEPAITYAEVALRLRLRRQDAKTIVDGLRTQSRHRSRAAAFPKSEEGV